MEIQDTITTTELKRLIAELLDHRPGTRIRFRLMGNMWENDYVQIVHATANSLVAQQVNTNELRFISLKQIMEFEVEQKFREFRPHFHYKVQA